MDTTELLLELERRRASLRMSKAMAARRAGLSLATVNRLLSAQEKRPGIEAVSALAAVLGLQVTLGARREVRASQSAAEFRERQARTKARRLVGIVKGSMALEAEDVSEETVREMEEQAVHELLAGSSRKLWSD